MKDKATPRRQTLTVAIPCYNHGGYLPECLNAILKQDREPDEILVLNDASTDDSEAVIKTFATKYPRIRGLRHEQNQGMNITVRDLAQEATSDFIYIPAADDFIENNFFSSAMDLADSYPTVGIVFGQMNIVDETGNLISTTTPSRLPTRTFLTPGRFLSEYLHIDGPNHILCAATIFRRAPFVQAGSYRPELGHWADSFAASVLGLTHGACYIDRPCTNWRQLEGQLSAGISALQMATIMARATALMRSTAFKNTFPPSYVRKLEREYRDKLIFRGIFSYRTQLLQTVQDLTDTFEKSVPNAMLAYCASSLVRLAWWITSRRFKQQMIKRCS